MNKNIKLNETELKQIVSESVKKVLKESEDDELRSLMSDAERILRLLERKLKMYINSNPEGILVNSEVKKILPNIYGCVSSFENLKQYLYEA